MKQYDAIMIGFGKGAKTLAADLARQGQKVAVIERSESMYGGTCINVGCIPTKSLINSARLARAAGRTYAEKDRLFREAMAEKDRLTAALRKKNYDKLKALGVDVVDGRAQFADAHTVRVFSQAGETRLRSEKIFINTGSKAVMPPIEGANSPGVYTSETLLALEALPQRLVVIGGGYIGLEFASMFADFGSDVTVLAGGEKFLPRDDEDIAQEILNVLSKRMRIVVGAQVTAISKEDGEKTVRYAVGGKQVSAAADAVLLATGRRPDTAELDLEAAGVETLPGGAVKTDASLKAADNIWAMGDCKGGPMFTYISLDDYRIVRSSLSGGGKTVNDRGALAYSVFIRPAYSHVGMTETEARAKGYEVAVNSLRAAAVPKANVLRQPEGLLKAVVDRSTGRILGVSLFCEASFETVNLVKLAIDAGLPYTALRDLVFTHPTMSEALNDLFDL